LYISFSDAALSNYAYYTIVILIAAFKYYYTAFFYYANARDS